MAAQGAVPYAIVGGVLALLVFLLICLLATMVWCSIRQKGGRGRKGRGPPGGRGLEGTWAGWEERGLLGGGVACYEGRGRVAKGVWLGGGCGHDEEGVVMTAAAGAAVGGA